MKRRIKLPLLPVIVFCTILSHVLSNDIRAVYRADSQIRIEWEPYRDGQVQHYEVIILPTNDQEGLRVNRAKVGANENSFVFTNLKPSTTYHVDVIAFVNFQPWQVYRLITETTAQSPEPWPLTPTTRTVGIDKTSVYWKQPTQFSNHDLKGFVIELRLPNETVWNRYGDIIEYRKGQKEYTTEIRGLNDKVVFVVRIYIVNQIGEVVAVSNEFSVGKDTLPSCLSQAGMPQNVEAFYISHTSITYVWNRPICDESYEPIEGFEYLFWNLNQISEPDRPIFVRDNKVELDKLTPNHEYVLKVRSRSRDGPSPWAEIRTVTRQESDRVLPKDIGIREPRVQQRGGDHFTVDATTTTVTWDVVGSTQKLCCFQVELRSDRDSDWRLHGSEVLSHPNQQTYSQELRNLEGNTRYWVRINGLAPDRSSLFISPQSVFTTQCKVPQSPPDNIEIRTLDSRTIVLSWNHPDQSTWDCTEIWYNVEGFANNQPQHFEVRADPRGYRTEYRISTEPGIQWRLSVQTANTGGVSPWSAEHTVQTPIEAYVDTPRLISQGSQIRVDWYSQGQGSGVVYGYYIEYITSHDPQWQSQRSFISYRGDNIPYSGVINNVPVGDRVHVRILVIDRNQRTIYTSGEAYIDVTCTAPTHPPANFQIYAPNSRHVRITWEASGADISQCPDLMYEIQVLEPASVQMVRLHGSQTSHNFEAKPNQWWMIQIRAMNQMGTSQWSQARTVITSPPQELIIGPTVSYEPTMLSWRSVENVEELVLAYRVEIQLDYDPSWRPHSSGTIRYIGHQTPYSVPFNDLPEGRTVQARVVVIDRNNDIAYTSPGVNINVPSRCPRSPSNPPSNLRAQSSDNNQIAVTWTPLSQSEWNCDRVWYILKYASDHSVGSRNLSSYENSATFDSEPGTGWVFQIQAVNLAGASRWSTEERGQTELGIPGKVNNFRIDPIGPDTLQLTWIPPYNFPGRIDNYEITYQLLSRGMCGDSPDREIVETSRDHSYTLQGLYPHSRYRILIRARTNVAGETVAQEVTTPVSTPSAPPRNVQAQDVRAEEFTVVWQSPPCLQTNGEVREYEYEMIGLDPWASIERYTNRVTDTRVCLDRLTPNTMYQIKVRAWTTQGAGPWSTEINVSTDSSDEPSSPAVLRAIDAQPNSIQLMWQAPYPPRANINQYKVQFSLSGTDRWQEREFRLNDLHCSPEVLRSQRIQPDASAIYCTVINGLEPDQMYDFQVAAHAANSRRYSPWSNTEYGRTGAGPVQITNIQEVRSSDNSLDISWTIRPSDQSRVRGFLIFVNPVRGHGRSQEYRVEGNVYQYHIDNLSPNTQYNVTVQAWVDSGLHESLSRVMTTQVSKIPPFESQPTIIDKRANLVTVQWNAPRDSSSITGYIVEFKITSRGDWLQHGLLISHASRKPIYQHVVDGLTPNSDVWVRIRAVGHNDIRGDPGPDALARTECMEPSLPPQAVKIEPLCSDGHSQRIVLTWQRPVETTWRCDQIGYEIAYNTDKQPLEQTLRVPSTQSEHSFQAAPFEKWTVRMRSVNRVGNSKWSQSVEAVTCEGEPGRVRNLVVTAISGNEARVTWSAPVEKTGLIEGYDILYRLKKRLACPDEAVRDASQNWITVVKQKKFDYMLTGLYPYAEYEVKVQARGHKLGPAEMRVVQTQQHPPSAPPLDLKSSYVLEKSLGFAWHPLECTQRRGHITTYEYEIFGRDSWAILERRYDNTSQLKVDVINLTPFTKYIMRVKAYNSAGAGPTTADLEVATASAAAPLAPNSLSEVEKGIDLITVSWKPPYPPYGPLESYRIQYAKEGPDGLKWVLPYESIPQKDVRLRCRDTNLTNPRRCFNITGLDPGSTYRIQVSAKIQDGSFGPWTQSLIMNTLEPAPETVTTIQFVNKSSTMLHISWIPPPDPRRTITDYKVCYEPTANQMPPKCFTVTHPKLNYVFLNLQPNTQYLITVQVGREGRLGPKALATYTTEPEFIYGLKTTPIIVDKGPQHLSVEWVGLHDQSNRVQGYIIEYRQLRESSWHEFGGVTRHDSLKQTYLERITNLNPDTEYTVRIKVVYKDKRVSESSPEARGRTGCTAPTSPPSNFEVQAHVSNEVRANWRPPPLHSWQCSNIRFRIEYRNGTGGGVQYIELPGTDIERTFYSLAYTQWSFRIRTENDAGHSHWSDYFVVTTPEGVPGPPRDVIGKPGGEDKIDTRWKPPIDPRGVITGYMVTYMLKPKPDCPQASSTQSIIKFVVGEKYMIKDLLPNSVYEIRVKAKTTVEGQSSEPILVKTDEAPPTGPPTKVIASSIHKSSMTFTWNEPLCEHRNGEITKYEYRLDSLDPSAQGFSTTDFVTDESLEVQNLMPYTYYQFQIKAISSKGAGPYAPPLIVQTKPGAPPPPTDVQADETTQQAISVSFLPPVPPNGIIDEYRIRFTLNDRIAWQERRITPDSLVCSGNRRERLCYRVIDLESMNQYIIQISAHTRDGEWGEWSQSQFVTTTEPEIPIVERPLHISDVKSDQVTVIWDGLAADQLKNVNGYTLEVNREGTSDWFQYQDVYLLKGTHGGQIYSEIVRNLKPDTLYFFRLRVVDKRDRSGQPGPDAFTRTLCGEPTIPPRNIKLTAPTFNQLKVTYETPSQDTWRCRRVVYVLKYQNDTSSGQIELEPTSGNQLELPSFPGREWRIEMKTQAVNENGDKGESSDWSHAQTIKTPGLPNLNGGCKAISFDQAECNWHLPDNGGDDDWREGVKITYQMKQRGMCPPAHFPEVTDSNVLSHRHLLQRLQPYSLYIVTITPNAPPYLNNPSYRPTPVQYEFRTQAKEPTGPPLNVRSSDITDRSVEMQWEKPECDKQNGEIETYEYRLVGLDSWVKGQVYQSSTIRQAITIKEFQPGTLYSFEVKAYTIVGPGPSSHPIEVRTKGGYGPPREVIPFNINYNQLSLTWLPPANYRGDVQAYRIRYGAAQNEVEVLLNEIRCHRYQAVSIMPESLCYTLTSLRPLTTYNIEIQAKAANGVWSPWTIPVYVTTPQQPPITGGTLDAVFRESERIKIRWEAPSYARPNILYYLASVYDHELPSNTVPLQTYNVSQFTNDYLFSNLRPSHRYNFTVKANNDSHLVWFISKPFRTSDKGQRCSYNIEAPSNLMIVDKTDHEMRISWEPAKVTDDLILYHQVNLSLFHPKIGRSDPIKVENVNYHDTQHKFFNLDPTAIYNISIQAFTSSHGSCEVLWGSFSTLDPPGRPHVLKLKKRTTKTLHVYWHAEYTSGIQSEGYSLTATPLWAQYGEMPLAKADNNVPADKTDYTFRRLKPGTVYNVTLTPKNTGQIIAWGVYSTLPKGSLTISDMRVCDETQYSFSLSWDPVEDGQFYKIRYGKLGTVSIDNDNGWEYKTADISHIYFRCPGNDCMKMCYLIFNLDGTGSSYVVQVSVFAEDDPNRWKTLIYTPSIPVVPSTKYGGCCIVPPPYRVLNIGDDDYIWKVWIKPVATHQHHVKRYYVLVDDRDPPGSIDESKLYDKVTAKRKGIPYYVTAAFDTRTLTEPEGREFPIGDGKVYGGYLNYPLPKDKKHNWAFVTIWDFDGKPVIGYHRENVQKSWIEGWPWWWLLLFLLFLLLLILLLCCLCWCLSGRYRKRKVVITHVDTMNGVHEPLLDTDVRDYDGELAVNVDPPPVQQEAPPSAGAEIHTTKVYHVYYQLPEDTEHQSNEVQLTQKLEGPSKRSKFRHHYTPGDYLKYADDNKGAAIYRSESLIHGHRRSLSASNLDREEPISTTTSRTKKVDDHNDSEYSDKFNKLYKYRTRSDMSSTMPRHYLSQTLLDGVRPGPTTSSRYREATETLQQQLDSISRGQTPVISPLLSASAFHRGGARGYSNDTGYVYDAYRSQGDSRVPAIPSVPSPRDDFHDYDNGYQHYSNTTKTISTQRKYNTNN